MKASEVSGIIDQLASKLGSTATELVAIYVPKVVAEAWIYTALGLVMFIFSLIIGACFWKFDGDDGKLAAPLAVCIGVFILFLFLGANVPDIMAPKAAAISTILGTIPN